MMDTYHVPCRQSYNFFLKAIEHKPFFLEIQSSSMNSIIVPFRPLASPAFLTILSLRPSLLFSKRHASSARRTTKNLRVKPDPTFTSSIHPDKIKDHIVFNPPSSAPSVYQTPVAFLPPDDPRRQLLAQSHSHSNPYSDPSRRLPPSMRPPYEKKYHLGPDQIEDIRRLRAEDPFRWTRKKLAEKFDCSQFFVGMVVQASKERKEQQIQILKNVKERWGWRRRYAREDRAKRRKLWGRDE